MSPILESIGSVKGFGWSSLVAPSPSYDSIATVTVGGTAQSNITFSSIPSTYKHLQLRGILNTSTATNPKFYYNTDVTTNGNYRGHHLWSTGGGSYANDNTVNYFNYNPSTSYPSVFVMDILDYASTTKTKTARIIAGSDTNGGTSEVAIWSSLWFISPIQAINQIVLQGNGADFNQYSQIALYGIRG